MRDEYQFARRDQNFPIGTMNFLLSDLSLTADEFDRAMVSAFSNQNSS
jgi:hypothetical protein